MYILRERSNIRNDIDEANVNGLLVMGLLTSKLESIEWSKH